MEIAGEEMLAGDVALDQDFGRAQDNRVQLIERIGMFVERGQRQLGTRSTRFAMRNVWGTTWL